MINLQIEIFLLLAIGYILSKKRIITHEVKTKLTTLSLSLILPCAIIRSFELDITYKDFRMCFIVLVCSFAIQFLYTLVNQWMWNSEEPQKAINLKYGTLVSNAGFFGMPIAQAAYGELGLLFASFFLIPQRVVMWSAGLSLYTTKTSWQEKVKKVITHPCIIALAIGFAILLMRMKGIYLPSSIDQTIAAISACNTPICLFVIGAMLEQSETKDLFSKTMRKYCLLRLLILPAIVLVIMKSFQLPLLAIQICVIESAMPAATTSAMLALRYDQDPAFASKMVFVSTLFSLFTLPLWLYIL